MDIKGFIDPNRILRPAPFWAINERITSDETARQIAEMIDAGFSGGFFHSRHGLITEYMGDEWFEAMRTAINAAKVKGGYLWLYDEDLWPSGNAGGNVAGMKDEYRAAVLVAYLVKPGEKLPEFRDDEVVKQCYVLKSRDGLHLQEYEILPPDMQDTAESLERLLLVRRYAPKVGWWSGESYANLLHPEAVKEFVKQTHEVYYQKLGSEFGKCIPGIFTDEPQILYTSNGIAWYEGLPELYANWTGRDFWADMPFMFFEGPLSRKVRLLVHRTVNRQFIEAFTKPLFDWCEDHGIIYTGHFNAEDTLDSQIMYHAGGVMGHYRYQHAPGIDHLCRQLDEGFRYGGGILLTLKQASSAARQLGRNQVLDEIFGVTRHTSTFEDFKWIGDFDLVNGANFFVPHLAWYSAKGRRKRDYPPNWNYQQTYWNDLRLLNDYFTRTTYALTQGKPATNIVMLHAIESGTAARRLGIVSNEEVFEESIQVAAELDQHMRKALEAILSCGYDCDLGDESFIEDLGSVTGDSFVIGEMSYNVVVVPPSTTWRPKTFELLQSFVTNSGTLIILGETPIELDCDNAHDEWLRLLQYRNVRHIPCESQEIRDLISEISPETYLLQGANGVAMHKTYTQHRIDGDQEIFFIVNADRHDTQNYIMTFFEARDKHLIQWDALNASTAQLQLGKSGSNSCVEFTLPPCGSILLTLGCDVTGHKIEEKKLPRDLDDTIPLPTEFAFTRSEENVLVLDRISVSYDGGNTFEAEDMEHRVRKNVLNYFGTQAMLDWQPWVAIRKGIFDGKSGDIILRYTFRSDIAMPRSFIVMEDLHKGALSVNGIPVDTSNPDWHWDRGFGKAEITQLVKAGENIVDFKVRYDILTEIEQAYIVGDFGVEIVDSLYGKIVAERETLRADTWTDQGYPFYVGRMTYTSSFTAPESGPTMLRLLNPSGTLFKIYVNGVPAGNILWRPYTVDLTPFVRSGKNDLAIEVVSSLQNAWGPLHENTCGGDSWCGPEAFEDDNILHETINIFPYGLLGGAEIICQRKARE